MYFNIGIHHCKVTSVYVCHLKDTFQLKNKHLESLKDYTDAFRTTFN